MISPPFISKGRRGRKRAEQLRRGANRSEVRDEVGSTKGGCEDFSRRGGKQSRGSRVMCS